MLARLEAFHPLPSSLAPGSLESGPDGVHPTLASRTSAEGSGLRLGQGALMRPSQAALGGSWGWLGCQRSGET